MPDCSNCSSMKAENKQLRKAIIDTNKGYVEVVNENLALKKELELANQELFTRNPTHR